MTIGVTMPARLAQVLNSPAVRPVASRGATSAITAQPSDPTPLPKKARLMPGFR